MKYLGRMPVSGWDQYEDEHRCAGCGIVNNRSAGLQKPQNEQFNMCVVCGYVTKRRGNRLVDVTQQEMDRMPTEIRAQLAMGRQLVEEMSRTKAGQSLADRAAVFPNPAKQAGH